MSSWAAGSARYSRRPQPFSGRSGRDMIHGAVRWKRCRRPTARLDPRDELDGRGARPDDSHALAAEVVVLVPCRRVEGRSLEALEAREVGDRRRAERPSPEHEHPGAQRAARGLQSPALGLLVPRRVEQLVAETDVGDDAVALRAGAQVGPDLRLRGEGARPLRVRGEGERVQVRGHVAGAARVAVVAPRAADVVGLLQDDEVLDPSLTQSNGHPQPGDAGADDGHPHILLNIIH
jgi:hypothetical protein